MNDTTARRLPRWSELSPLVKPRPFVLDPIERRLARAQDIQDLRTIARRRAPRSVFDYVDGAAEDEISLARARAAFGDVEFRPSVLRDVSAIDPGTDILGARSALPFVLAPTGFTRMMHHEGEVAVAGSAAAAGVPYTLSTMGTTSIEGVASAAPGGRNWFQLYLWKDREASSELVVRAREAGYDTLMLTVDTPIAGARRRDVRNGLTVPPMLTLRTLADMSRHPSWWVDKLTTEPLEFASLSSWEGTVADLVGHMFDPSAGLAELRWLREQWPGSLVVKGIQSADDARTVVDAGADAVVVSNHGGRQLDRAPTPLELLPSVLAAVPTTPVLLDTGITSGADVVAAVAMGAAACLIGRAYLYGLMAGGRRGVDRSLAILTSEVVRTMALLGAPTVDDLVGRAVLRPPRG